MLLATTATLCFCPPSACYAQERDSLTLQAEPLQQLGLERRAIVGPVDLAHSIAQDLDLGDVDTPYLLALKAEEREGTGLYIENALLAVRFANSDWDLYYVYRHPKESREDKKRWYISVVTDMPYTGSRKFNSRPGRKEVEQFLHDSWWVFGADEYTQLVSGEVFIETWQKALGYRPDYHFPQPKS